MGDIGDTIYYFLFYLCGLLPKDPHGAADAPDTQPASQHRESPFHHTEGVLNDYSCAAVGSVVAAKGNVDLMLDCGNNIVHLRLYDMALGRRAPMAGDPAKALQTCNPH